MYMGPCPLQVQRPAATERDQSWLQRGASRKGSFANSWSCELALVRIVEGYFEPLSLVAAVMTAEASKDSALALVVHADGASEATSTRVDQRKGSKQAGLVTALEGSQFGRLPSSIIT